MLYADGITDNTIQLQEMLDKRGIVTVDRPGTYLVSKTLIIHSDTRLIFSPGARILAAPMSRCALIENEHVRIVIHRNKAKIFPVFFIIFICITSKQHMHFSL